MIQKTVDWMLHPITERELLEESRLRLARRRAGWLFVGSVLLLSPVTFLQPLFSDVSSLDLIAYLGFALNIGALLEYLRRARLNDQRRTERQQALFAEYRATHESWLVELTLYQGAALTGKDQGALWFEDGRLYFSGYRTSFALTPGDVFSQFDLGSFVEDVRPSLTLYLKTRTPVGRASLGLDVVPSSNRPDPLFIHQLAQTVCKWHATPNPEPGQTPPLTVGPETASHRRLLLRALAASGYWLLLAVAAIRYVYLWPISVAILAIGTVLSVQLPEVWLPLRRWNAYTDRLALDRLANDQSPS